MNGRKTLDSKKKEVRLGIIGLGYMAQGVHIPCFAKAENCQIAGLADKDTDLAKRVAAKWQIPKVFQSAEELLCSDQIDAVAILVPPQFNAPLAIQAVEHGKDVLCEKPLAFTAQANQAVADAAQQAKRTVMVAYQKRYDAAVQYIKKLLADKQWQAELGRITYARFHNFCGSFRGDLEQPYEKSAAQVEHQSLGALDLPDWVSTEDHGMFFCSYTNFSHDMNLMRYLLGDPGRAVAGFRRPGPNNWVTFSTTLFDYGPFCSILETGLVEYGNFDEWFQIYFERGWIEVRFNRVLLRDVPAKVTIMTKDRGTMVPHLGYSWNFQRQAEGFIQSISAGRQPLTDAQETLGDTALAKMWYLAAKTEFEEA